MIFEMDWDNIFAAVNLLTRIETQGQGWFANWNFELEAALKIVRLFEQ